MREPGFLFYILQRQEGRGSVFVTEMCLVSQLVGQAVVVSVAVDSVSIGNAAAAGCCAQGHGARDGVLVSTSAATGEFEW
jgi:hypothetical protein